MELMCGYSDLYQTSYPFHIILSLFLSEKRRGEIKQQNKMAATERLENVNPHIFAKAGERLASATDWDDCIYDPFDSREIFDLIRNIRDPEHPLTLEELNVVIVCCSLRCSYYYCCYYCCSCCLMQLLIEELLSELNKSLNSFIHFT